MNQENEDLQPKELDLSTSTFEANGHIYHVEKQGRLSIARDQMLEKLSLYALLGRQASALLQEARRAYEAINSGRPADCAVILDDLMKAAVDLNSKEAPLYYVCTLFINREGEDRRKYDLELAKQKIADWQNEGYEAFFFLKQGLDYLSFTETSWSETIQNILPVEGNNLTPLQ